jgi:hypothetical protein
MAPDDSPERLEIERLESSAGLDLLELVGYEQLAILEPDISLHTRETMGQSVEKRTGVFEVIVGVRSRQWNGGLLGGSKRSRAAGRRPRRELARYRQQHSHQNHKQNRSPTHHGSH